jgi:hypothetical protein
MHPSTVVNMDQTPLPFSYHGNKTLEVKGTKTIHIKAPGEKDRATVNAAITMGGDLLKLMCIFKGQP